MNIPQLTENDLEIYKRKKIVIYGFSEQSIYLYQIFKLFHFDAVILNNTSDNRLFNELDFLGVCMGIPIIKPEKFALLLEKHKDNLIIQTVEIDNAKVTQHIEKHQCLVSPYSYGQITMSFLHLTIFKLFNNPITYKACELFWKARQKKLNQPLWKTHNIEFYSIPLLLCLPPKTADYSLMYTFNQINKSIEEKRLASLNQSKIEFQNLWHKPQKFNRQAYTAKYQKIKMIVGIREPIAQDLSMFYQKLASGNIYFDWMLGVLTNKSMKERNVLLKQFLDKRNNHRCDAQSLWYEFIDRYVYTPDGRELLSLQPNSIQNFIKDFQQHVYDIEAIPFDREKGFGVLKEDDIEIFVYQLEKLNDLAPELSEWIGVPFDKLENANLASDKWIAESYQQAKKEIEITQEYFDKCFDEAYVKHCYSEADIEKFKARWRSHIK